MCLLTDFFGNFRCALSISRFLLRTTASRTFTSSVVKFPTSSLLKISTGTSINLQGAINKTQEGFSFGVVISVDQDEEYVS
mmetsp:Transcript_52257/g.78056  ORF Transcript_52257/g.78056 Transcript_52257/m.78056 type:complete len:81 (-) Transcript_52257:606-848(-)